MIKRLVAAGWQKKLVRLSQMGAPEVAVRLAQSFYKQKDWALYRLGLGQHGGSHQQPGRRAGGFFFTNEEAMVRASLVRLALPQQVEEICREADAICSGSYKLLGYDELKYGAENDWHRDVVHDKQAPLRAWFKVPFLDFAKVGDHKITWELNRHQHLVTLAKASLYSGNPHYTRELIRQFESWQRSNVYPVGINWASSLEVAFRALSWTWIDHLVSESESTAKFRLSLRAALELHGRYIHQFLSTYFSPNTHLLGELGALFFLGTLYPDMRGAGRWRSYAWKAIEEEARRQVRPDGVYFEQSLHYHVYALDFFLHARRLAHLNSVPASPEFDIVLSKMLDVVAALSQTGPAEGFGDDDGGRLFNPRRNLTEHLTDPLSIGRLLFKRTDLSAAQLTEESIWLFGESAVTELSHNSAKTPELRSVSFPDGGLYVVAAEQPIEQQWTIDAGPQGVGRCGHGHADALSLRMSAGGHRWLIDLGSGNYIGPDCYVRDFYRGTESHNTLRVDGTDQAIPEDAFSWRNIPTTRTERWLTGSQFKFFSGSHDGYARLSNPVLHQRQVLLLDDGICLVRDFAKGVGTHTLEVNWHFAPDLKISQAETWWLATAPDRNAVLQFSFAGGDGWSEEVLDEKCSPAYGRFLANPRVRARSRIQLPAEIGTLFRMNAARNLPGLRFSRRLADEVQAYELVVENEIHTFFFSSGSSGWQSGNWSCDAEVFYCRTQNSKLTQFLMLHGSYASFGGEPMLLSPTPFEWVEWSKQRGLVQVSPGTMSVPELKVNRKFVETEPANVGPANYAEKA